MFDDPKTIRNGPKTSMEFAPQRNWELYRERVAERMADAHRQDDESIRFERHAALFDMIRQARASNGDQRELQIERFLERAAERQKLVRVFQRMDELNRANESSNHPG